ncbi:response regulator transcription factor [Endozoicomonas ascidiicola]|uniref:response regulator transcription factor n=1 Tax=Endozoicomonas ascidiicola TaxID=1698521 RepID=UPI00082FB731|nr:response regulator transcription factor [Endozoicomonas ascidiicola]
MSIEVLLIEDDRDLACTVIDYLELEGIQCDLATNGTAGYNIAIEGKHDVLVLDINMPGMDGFEVCRKLRRNGMSTPILMLTAMDTLDDKLKGFETGADDYLVKPFALKELAARLKALAGRKTNRARRLTVGNLVMDLDTRTVTREGCSISLSPTCWSLLETLMKNAPDVVEKSKLEQVIWQGDSPDSDALKVHLYRLRQKIDKPFSHPLIHTVSGYGVVIYGEGSERDQS